ncbi:uncharacterized protein LOC117246461 [Epinephelus lanceolatus]|uniref:uncharacterized protein LOC117246461 n=1 Tax=Epinephelus lanceolatus TaxID=310571 RepID=UPI001446AC60|nr:uncharacterized protein LOC117246460 isoform X1 [Epinephelus lanceolatus]XP_033466280.1 uncharacterized protein LOC117246461 [Epinephelus lanceolatus]
MKRTMRSFTLTTALLLCSLSWISVSGSESQTVEVQPGEEVTLTCTNISSRPCQTDWFRLINRTKPSCISSMYWADGVASFCDGFQSGFEMSSNISTVFLKIKRVDLSDSGVYFCGFYKDTHTVIGDATHLKIQGNADLDDEVDFETENDHDALRNLMTVILGALMVFFMVAVIVLAVKIKQRQKAENEELHPERNKNPCTDDLNSAALRFLPETIRNRRPESEKEVETRVIYTASR